MSHSASFGTRATTNGSAAHISTLLSFPNASTSKSSGHRTTTLSANTRAELASIWVANPRIPSLSSRQIWAHTRGISPAAVHQWFRRTRDSAVKRGIPIGEGTYDLTIQAPSLAVKTEEGVHGSFETYTTESGSYVTKSAKAEAKEVTIPKRKYKPEGTATTQNPPSKKMKKALGPAYVAKNSVQPGSQRHIRRGAHSTPEIIIINTDEFLSMASAASKSMLNDLFDILGIESDLLHATLSGRQAAAADCKAKAHAADDPFLPRPGQQRWSSTKRVLPRMSPLPLASELSCRSIVSGSTSLRESTPLTETSTAPRLVDSLPSRPARPTGSASLKINRQQAAARRPQASTRMGWLGISTPAVPSDAALAESEGINRELGLHYDDPWADCRELWEPSAAGRGADVDSDLQGFKASDSQGGG